jgi:hypothetical protein
MITGDATGRQHLVSVHERAVDLHERAVALQNKHGAIHRAHAAERRAASERRRLEFQRQRLEEAVTVVSCDPMTLIVRFRSRSARDTTPGASLTASTRPGSSEAPHRMWPASLISDKNIGFPALARTPTRPSRRSPLPPMRPSAIDPTPRTRVHVVSAGSSDGPRGSRLHARGVRPRQPRRGGRPLQAYG